MPLSPERIPILGVPFAPLSQPDAISAIRAMLRSHRRHQVVLANAHTLNCAHTDPDYRRILQEAALVLRDGVGVEIAARLARRRMRHNFCGTDFVPELLDALADPGIGVFLFGAAPGVAAEAAAVLESRNPAIRIAGIAHGYEAADAVAARIRAARPDILLVALGNPLQERWIAEHLDTLDVRVAIGVGALFDNLARRVPRAPAWLRRARGEWLFRLCVEPRRLWRRYVVGNAAFLWRVLRQGTDHRDVSMNNAEDAAVLTGRAPGSEVLPDWQGIASRGWLPERGRVVVQLGQQARTPQLLATAQALVRYLAETRPALAIQVLDPGAVADDWAGHPAESIADGETLRVAGIAAPELRVPRLWFQSYALITLAGCAPSASARLGAVLEAQAEPLCRTGNQARRTVLAYEAHRLAPSDLCIVCGVARAGGRVESWWAASPSDVALEQRLAGAAGLRSDRLPLLRFIARHELVPHPHGGADDLPRLADTCAASWLVATTQAGERARDALAYVRRDAAAVARTLGKVPAALRRRLASRRGATA